jgi:hypothetical protein
MSPVTKKEKQRFLEEAMEKKGAYAEFLAMRNEILRHKWFRSQEEKMDIGFDAALVDWTRKYGEAWHEADRKEKTAR